MNKTFPIQLSEDLHRKLKHAAIDDGMTLHDWIIKTLEEKLGNGTQRVSPKRVENYDRRKG